MRAAKRVLLLLATQCLVPIACGGTTPPWDYPDPFPLTPQPILCGQPLPAKCQYQSLSFSELPSRAPAAENLGEWAFDARPGSHQAKITANNASTDAATLVEWAFHQSLQAKISANRERIPESTFGLECVARGCYGDSLEVRQDSERRLAKLLFAYRDDGGAVDLTHLLVRDSRDAAFWIDQEWLVGLTRRCRSAKALHTLTLVDESELSPWFDSTPEFDAALAVLNLLSAYFGHRDHPFQRIAISHFGDLDRSEATSLSGLSLWVSVDFECES